MVEELELDVGGFLTFADFFLDNLFSDLMVQGEIDEALAQVEEAMEQVTWTLNKLKRLEEERQV